MATLTEQQELEQLRVKLNESKALQSSLMEEEAPAKEPVATKDSAPKMATGGSVGYYGGPRGPSFEPISPEARGVIADILMEGGGAAAGAMIGAFPALSVPTAGLSIPAGAAIGGLIGNAGGQLRRGQDYKVGEGAAAVISGLAGTPGAGAIVRGGARVLAREAVKQGVSQAAAVTAQSAIDEGKAPDAGELAIATAAGVAGAGLAKAATSGKKVASETAEMMRNIDRDFTMRLGSEVGYVFDAVKMNPNALTKSIAKMGVESEIHKQAIGQNQKVTNALVRQELGMPETWSISEGNVKGAVDNAKKPYHKLRAIGPDADALVSDLENTYKTERDAWRKWREEGGAELKDEAVAAGEKADAIENTLEKIATKSGSPGIVDELREARVKLAKLRVVQDSANLPAGNIDARVLAAINKAMPTKLTGGLKLAAQAASIQPYMFKAAEKVAPSSSRTGQVAGGLIGLSGGMAAGQASGIPGGAMIGGTLGAGLGVAGAGALQELLSEPFQRLASSKTYQQALGVPRYQLNAPEAIPAYLLQTAKAAGR